MSRIQSLMRRKLNRTYTKLSRNWKPKLICLGLAILVWTLVQYSTTGDETQWDEDDTRIVIPE